MITLENIHVRSRLQGTSVSVCGSDSLAGHEHCTLLNTTYNEGVPAITGHPVGWAVPAPLESALVQSHPESHAGDLCTGGCHAQDPITSKQLEYCTVNLFQMLEMCLKIMDLARGKDVIKWTDLCPFRPVGCSHYLMLCFQSRSRLWVSLNTGLGVTPLPGNRYML